MQVRRIIIGQTSGRSTLVADEAVDPITVGLFPGVEMFSLWGSDSASLVPSSGERPAFTGWFPAPEGFRFVIVTLPPETADPPGEIDLEAKITEVAEKLPGIDGLLEQGESGIHATDTVDLVVILSGEVWLELDDEKRTLVEAGGVVIQNGTRHAWRNQSDRPCVMAVTMLGATRTD